MPSVGHISRVLTVKLLICSLAASVAAGVVLHSGHGGRFAQGGSDGAGGIPYSGGPQGDPGIKVQHVLTIGLVINTEEIAVPDVPVIVMAFDGSVVATGVTDDRGLFAVDLPVLAGLTISLPMNGVSELPIEAGEAVLIIVP